MVRYIILFILFLVVYYAIRSLIRSALKTATKPGERRQPGIQGQEMVLDPQCNTYVVKQRAIGRHINGNLTFFCSEECARAYEEKQRRS